MDKRTNGNSQKSVFFKMNIPGEKPSARKIIWASTKETNIIAINVSIVLNIKDLRQVLPMIVWSAGGKPNYLQDLLINQVFEFLLTHIKISVCSRYIFVLCVHTDKFVFFLYFFCNNALQVIFCHVCVFLAFFSKYIPLHIYPVPLTIILRSKIQQ